MHRHRPLVIIAVIGVNGIFSYWHQYQAERAVEALRALLPYQVTVCREGRLETRAGSAAAAAFD